LLEGIRVIDFTWAFVGPQTTKTLADCGAEVIRIESKTRPGFWRTRGPFKDNIPGLDRGIPFATFNTNKLSITLNFAKPEAIEIAKRLIAGADIVVDNFAGGSMERMGLGYEELKKIKPDIIMLSACMHGQTGPYAAHPGFGNQLTALCGFSHISGWPDREPVDLGATISQSLGCLRPYESPGEINNSYSLEQFCWHDLPPLPSTSNWIWLDNPSLL